MNYRKDKFRSKRNKKNIFMVLTLIFVFSSSFVISNFIARFIYNETVAVSLKDNNLTEEKVIEGNNGLSDIRNNDQNIKKVEEAKIKNYADNLSSENIILFQGGVFTDLENAEEFRENINDKFITTIVNDNKYERIVLGISNKDNFIDKVNGFREENIQFIQQVYKINIDEKYNKEIVDITNLIIDFIDDNEENILKGKSVLFEELKKKVDQIKPSYGDVGSYKLFNKYKDLIVNLDDKIGFEDINLIIDFIYNSFNKYKV